MAYTAVTAERFKERPEGREDPNGGRPKRLAAPATWSMRREKHGRGGVI